MVTRAIAALSLATIALSFAEAQEGGVGVKSGGRSSVPVLNNPASASLSQTVSLRIYPNSPGEANYLKDSLSRLQGVSEVKLSEDLRTVSCTYQGIPADLPKLERKSSGSLLSPARLVLALTRTAARAKDKTSGVENLLRSVGGVASVVVKGSRAELYANLELLDVKKLIEAAASAGYQAEVQSHAWWTLKIEGDASKLPEALADIKGVLKVERAGADAKVLALRALSADALVNAALKAGLKATATLASP
jgi:copper chaperone CopZ